jgi:DNA-binding MarR family transcriptional regulator
MNEIKLKLGDEAEGIAGFLLWQVSRLWQRHLTHALQDLKLPSTQAVVLANVLRISEEGEEITQAALSKATKIDRTTTSKALQALERRKLVTRAAPPGDLRAFQVRLSPRGRDVAFEIIKRFSSTHERFFRPAGRDNAQLVTIMQKLIRANDLS